MKCPPKKSRIMKRYKGKTKYFAPRLKKLGVRLNRQFIFRIAQQKISWAQRPLG